MLSHLELRRQLCQRQSVQRANAPSSPLRLSSARSSLVRVNRTIWLDHVSWVLTRRAYGSIETLLRFTWMRFSGYRDAIYVCGGESDSAGSRICVEQ